MYRKTNLDPCPDKELAVVGGFRNVAVLGVLRAWFLCAKLQDLRCYLALLEVAEKHKLNGQAAKRAFKQYLPTLEDRIEAVVSLTGLSRKRVQASLRRLEKAQIATVSDQGIDFTESAEGPREAEILDARGKIDPRRNKVPIPRRMLRYLARHGTKATIGVALGFCVRCLYLHREGVNPQGRCPSIWLAETFGLGKRTVKGARKELVELGWLLESEQTKGREWFAERRHGRQVTICLDWKAPEKEKAKPGTILAPFKESAKTATRESSVGTTFAPFKDPAKTAKGQEGGRNGTTKRDEFRTLGERVLHPSPKKDDLEPVLRTEHHNPEERPAVAKNGVCHSGSSEDIGPGSLRKALQAKVAEKTPEPQEPAKKPPLPHVEARDLHKPKCLKALLQETCKCGAISRSEIDRQDFYASVARSTRVADNPPAMLAAFMKKPELRKNLADCDDIEGSLLFKQAEYGQKVHQHATPNLEASNKTLSEDARVLDTTCRLLKQQRQAALGPFVLLRQKGWDLERYKAAEKELAELQRSNYRKSRRIQGEPEALEAVAARIGEIHLPDAREHIEPVKIPAVAAASSERVMVGA